MCGWDKPAACLLLLRVRLPRISSGELLLATATYDVRPQDVVIVIVIVIGGLIVHGFGNHKCEQLV
jgi:hypothetical protein